LESGPRLAGVTDLSEIGIKRQIQPFKKLIASVVASVNVPTGSRAFSDRGVEPVFRVPYSILINRKWSLCGMQSLLVLNSGRNVSYEPFVMVTRTLGSRSQTEIFAEYAGFFTHRLPTVQFAHFGCAYKLRRHHQVDIHFGFGLDKSAPVALVGVGYSYRFDGLPWPKSP
jgi:hypothetical protein